MTERRLGRMAVAAFALVAGLTVVRTLHELNVAGAPHVSRFGMQDFRDAVYYPVVALLDGHNPYDVADYLQRYPVGRKFPLYSPVTLLVHLPFGFLPQDAAAVAHLAVNLLMTVALAAMSLSIAGLGLTWTRVLGLATLVLVSHPGEMTLFIGQPSIYVALGVYLAFYWARSRPILAGLGLALACLKPTFGVPAALLLLARGDVAAVGVGLGVATAASAGVGLFLVAAAGGIGPFLGSLEGNLARFGEVPSVTVAASVHRIDALLVLGRLLGRPLGRIEAMLSSLAVLGFAAWAVRRLRSAQGEEASRLEWTIVCLAVLACCYHQVYDAVLFLLPGVLLVRARRSALDAGVLLVIGFVASSYFASYALLERIPLGDLGWRLVTSLNAAAVATALLLTTIAAYRAAHARAAARSHVDSLLTSEQAGRMGARAPRPASLE